jgi:hypothetical protein
VIKVIKAYSPKVHDIVKRSRAQFDFNGKTYDLSVTDPLVKERYLHQRVGDYPIRQKGIGTYLSVSLGEPYNGYVYKIVAGIINLPEL